MNLSVFYFNPFINSNIQQFMLIENEEVYKELHIHFLRIFLSKLFSIELTAFLLYIYIYIIKKYYQKINKKKWKSFKQKQNLNKNKPTTPKIKHLKNLRSK